MTTLHRRLGALESKLADARGPGSCRACGLRHVRPLTLALLRGVLRVAGGSEQVWPTTRLCLCDPCCGEAGDRWLARASHGLPIGKDAV